MKYSIKNKFAIIFTLLMAGTILVCWVLNTLFLENYYISNKTNTLNEAYKTLKEASEIGTYTEEFRSDMEKICFTGNINVLVLTPNGQVSLRTMPDADNLMARLNLYMFKFSSAHAEIIYTEDKYMIQKVSDTKVNSDFLEIWGVLSNGNSFLMRTALESVRESVNVSNRFLAYVGIAAVLVSAGVIYIVAKKMTDPILELANISERMIHLDFDTKYVPKENNEIDLLGKHINQLSRTLEVTISELKTANNELQSDIEKKEQIDDIRKEFLSNVSHELKTPIALIQGYAEGLKECINDDEDSREFYCDVIVDEAGKMNQMVKKLLTLNQLEFGNEMIQMERFDIAELINDIIKSTDILIKQNEIKVIFEEKDSIPVWADEFKVEEVITNYLSNAIHHADGEKVVEIKIKKRNDLVRISVFNTGLPIPEEDLANVWIKFYKVDKARTREYGGSGIGLSIVKAIMESFNQECGVNNYDNGVEFWFELDGRTTPE